MASEMRKYKKQGRAEAKEYLRAKKEARLEGQEAYDEFADDEDYPPEEIRLMRIKFMSDYGH